MGLFKNARESAQNMAQNAASLAPRYPEWDRFQTVRGKLDPEGRFSNPYLERVLGPA